MSAGVSSRRIREEIASGQTSLNPRAEVWPLQKGMYFLGVTALVILGLGAAEFLYFEPLGQTTGTQAQVQGVYALDAESGRPFGADANSFERDQPFGALVDWSSLPPDLSVSASWYNGFGVLVGGVGPLPAREMVGTGPIRLQSPQGMKTNIPGEYLFVVERVVRGQPVEVLARRLVLVTRA